MGDKKKTNDPRIHLLAGASSGLLTVLLLQPFDLVKTRLQQERSGLLKAVRDAASPSFWRLWRGTWPTIWRNVPGHAMYFTALDVVRRGLSAVKLDGSSGALSKEMVNLVGGATARVGVGLILMPMTVIKVRYESNLYNYTSVWNAFQTITRKEGIRGLFAGFGSTAIRDAPYAGIYVVVYERMKLFLHAAMKSEDFKPVINMASGISSAILSSVVTQPFDVIRTRIQIKPQEYRNTVFAVAKILKEEGIRAFMSGLGPRLARKPLSAAITWTVYEELVRSGQ
ncbi:hypothetical protein SmJEL517_g04368 [Synchytrium microbalum]|uniref:Mitochondrial glycine transporter n=1 Tax=Synchytrium microbalum TaxID=1806994 RepID=A0A507C517_9FUNG|nr:uncharacterized protein SmJEL517_g04368 [Synchytrium microbalum]TPX32525.1 hypothetical protein SmJEL517_g04368 [Synchytrium microbalum]